MTALSVEDGLVFFSELDEKLKKQVKTAKKKDQQEIAGKYQIAEVPLREINNRLRFMDDVGLSYLTLERRSRSLSGGEAQRIRLASQIGSRLVGTLYILDEPTIGLHQRDNEKLISTLLELRDLGNTVLVVEHDEDTILASDYLVDIGPGAGIHGGHITAQGPMPELLKDKKQDSLSLQYLRGEKKVPIPAVRRKISKNGKFLTIKDATQNYTGKVVGLGSRIVEIPARMRKVPEFKTYGREVIIRLPAKSNFLQNEKLVLTGIKI